jgi:hypothetical protein
MKIIQEMSGLPQVGILAKQILKKRLDEHNYYEVEHTPGIFTHNTGPILFTQADDGLGVTYIGKQHAEHFVNI